MAATVEGSDVVFGEATLTTSVDLTVPAATIADDLIIVQTSFRQRPDISANYLNMRAEPHESVEQDIPGGAPFVEGRPLADADGRLYAKAADSAIGTFDQIYGPFRIETFTRRADGSEASATIPIFGEVGGTQSRGDVNVIAGVFIARGLSFTEETGAAVDLSADSSSLASPPKTPALSAATPAGVAWSFTAYAGTIGATPTATGWVLQDVMQLSPGTTHQQLAGALFTREHPGGILANSDISTVVLEGTEWMTLGGILADLGTNVHAALFGGSLVNTQNPGTPLGTDLVDNGGGVSADPVWFTWPQPVADKTLQPPNPPYRNPGTGPFREVK